MDDRKVKPAQAINLMGRLGGAVRWGDFEVKDVQKIIETPRLSGRHFEEFMRQGGRMSLENIPICILEERTVGLRSGDWSDQVHYVEQVIETDLLFSRSSHHVLVRGSVLLAPEDWRQRREAKVVVLEIIPEYAGDIDGHSVVRRYRMLELMELLDLYPSTFPEAVAFFEQVPTTHKPVVILNAWKNIYKEVGDVVFTSKQTAGRPVYEFGPIDGRVNDPEACGGHHYYLATRY